MPFTFKLSQRLARMRSRAVFVTLAILAGCEKPIAISTDPGGTAASQLVLSPRAVTLHTNQTVDLTAVGLTAIGDTATVAVTWSMTTGSVIDTSTSGGKHYGRYKAGTDTGTVKVIAHGHPGTSSDTSVVTVTAAPVAAVTVSPSSASLFVGQTMQLGATTTDSVGNVLSGRTVTWTSSNPAVATVNGSGFAGAVAVGSATITATSEGRTGSAVISVSNVPVATVTVSPASASVLAGQTVQLAATTRDASGNVLTGRSIVWTSSTGSVATVNGNGLVTGVTAGSATITATSEGQSGTATVSVSNVPVATVTVSPASASVQVGQTAQLTATTRDGSGNVLTGRTIVWVSGNGSMATVNGSGLVTGVTAGSATITATSEGQSGSAAMTVTSPPAPVATVTVSPGSASVGVGGTQQYTATLKDASGNVLTGRTVTWASSALGVATITGSGLASALVAGTATITATSEGKNGTGGLTVTALPPPPPSGTWPHEPSGWTVISDWGFDVAPPASSADLPIVGSPGWSVIYNGGAGPAGSNVALVSVAGAPLSPPAVYQFTYKQGFPAGVGPANVYHPVSTSRIYVGFWWRMSNPWTTTTAAQKLLYLMDGASNIVFDMQGNTGTASDPFWTRWVIDGTEYRGDVTYNLTPGVWYRIELVADLNAKTMQWWIYNPQSDAAPVLVGNKSGVAYATGTINQVQVAPTYGGLGTPAVQDQYFQYDHIHISGH